MILKKNRDDFFTQIKNIIINNLYTKRPPVKTLETEPDTKSVKTLETELDTTPLNSLDTEPDTFETTPVKAFKTEPVLSLIHI